MYVEYIQNRKSINRKHTQTRKKNSRACIIWRVCHSKIYIYCIIDIIFCFATESVFAYRHQKNYSLSLTLYARLHHNNIRCTLKCDRACRIKRHDTYHWYTKYRESGGRKIYSANRRRRRRCTFTTARAMHLNMFSLCACAPNYIQYIHIYYTNNLHTVYSAEYYVIIYALIYLCDVVVAGWWAYSIHMYLPTERKLNFMPRTILMLLQVYVYTEMKSCVCVCVYECG